MEVLNFVTTSLLFFLPAFVGNQFPGFAVWIMERCSRPYWNVPVSEKWLGKNKTWPAYPAAVLGAIGTIYLQRELGTQSLIDYSRGDLWLVGLLFGVGIIAGDHVKSFFKRRIPIPPGERFWPFDQLDFVVGGLAAVSLVLGKDIWATLIVIVPVVLVLNPFVNWLGFRLGLRKVPY